jgi:hypothetical protein
MLAYYTLFFNRSTMYEFIFFFFQDTELNIVVYLTSSCVNWALINSTRVEYDVILFDEPLNGSKAPNRLKCLKLA